MDLQNANELGSIVRPKPLGASRAAIQREADRVRNSLGWKPGADLTELVKQLGGKITFRSFWDTLISESGSIIIRGPRDFDIYLSDATSPRRDRFTIAHELGHYFLHFSRQRKEMVPGHVMVGQRAATGPEETEAHWFAAAFLMPEAEFRTAWEEDGGIIAVVADRFDVSTHAAAVRASSLGLYSD